MSNFISQEQILRRSQTLEELEGKSSRRTSLLDFVAENDAERQDSEIIA